MRIPPSLWMLAGRSTGQRRYLPGLPEGCQGSARSIGRTAVWIALLTAYLCVSPARAQDASRGKTLFAVQCAMCHGAGGDGSGREARRFTMRPADLTAGVFKYRSTLSGSLPTTLDLERTIRRGVPGTAMIAQDHLTDAQVRDLIAFIQTLSPRWAKEKPEPPIDLVPPPNLDALAAKGPELYRKAACFQCHGPTGHGDGPSARQLTEHDRPVRPPDLTRRPLGVGNDVRDVFRTLVTGLDGTPMLGFRDAFDDPDLWAIARYVAGLTPPGKRSPLSRDEQLARSLVMRLQPGRLRPPAQASVDDALLPPPASTPGRPPAPSGKPPATPLGPAFGASPGTPSGDAGRRPSPGAGATASPDR